MYVSVTKSNSFIAEQKCIIACAGSTGRKYSYSDSLQKEEANPRSRAEDTQLEALPG